MALTKTLLASLTLALGLALTAPAAPALACGGGYGSVDPDEGAIRAAALEYARSRRHRRGALHRVSLIDRTQARAEVELSVYVDGDLSSRRVLVLVRSHRGVWVVSTESGRA